jgi:Zn-dependent protease with chaperone function
VGFRRDQEQARAASGWMLLLFGLTVLLTVLGVNLTLALAWRLQFGWIAGYPTGFFETNTLVTLGFVLGGAWLESLQLRAGGSRVALMLGGREIAQPQTASERRLRNVVDEMAIASGLKSPRVFVLEAEPTINALAAGWDQQDSVIAVTRGALDRLNRDELQGVVAHEFAHILNGDTRLNMRLIGMVFGLQMVFNFGRTLMGPADSRRRGPAMLAGLALLVVGSIGWLAGRLLKAGVSRQREYLADADAIQFTRQPTGIGNALRKIAGQLERGERLRHVNAEVVSHLLLSSDTLVHGGWLATHPPIQERLRRIFGHDVSVLPDDPLPAEEVHRTELPPLEFTMQAAAVAERPSEAAATLPLPNGSIPEQLRAAVLACLVPPDGQASAELAAWHQRVGTSAATGRILEGVRALPQRARLPSFERLVGCAAALPLPDRSALLRDAVAIVQADGHLSLNEYLRAKVLQRQLSAHREAPIERRYRVIADVAAPIVAITATLASLLPADERAGWARSSLASLALTPSSGSAIPSVAELNQAVTGLAMLDRLQRPALVKAWLETASASSLAILADALRCLCLLIDTPLPPKLADCFDPLPAFIETQLPSHDLALAP